MVCRDQTGYRTLCSNFSAPDHALGISRAFWRKRVFPLPYFGSIALATSLLALAILHWPGTNSVPAAPEASGRIKRMPLQISEFTFTSQDQDRLVHVLQAKQLVIRPRRFMVFNIKSLNEVVLQNARLETHFYKESAKQSSLFDFQEVVPFDQSSSGKHHTGSAVGLVTRLIADRVRVDIFREDIQAIVLAAEYGLVEQKKTGAEFFNAILKDSRSDRVIRSSRVLWDETRMLFVIPGSYAMSASGNNTSGQSIEIDLDFNIRPSSRMANI